MPRIDVIAKAGCLYDGVPRPEGTLFDCELSDAKILKLIGKVEFADAPEDPGSVEAEPEPASRPRRRYRRRDLTAEA